MTNTHDFITRVEWEPENDHPNFKRAIDEIVTGPLDSFHIERMTDGCYWIGLYKGENHKRQMIILSIEIDENGAAKLMARTEAD